MSIRLVLAGLAVAALASLLFAAGPVSGSDKTVVLVGYAVPREALGELIASWPDTPAGQGVRFAQSYGASGDQARAVANGLDADVVHLSTGLDVEQLVKAELVDEEWSKRPYGGIATNSIVVFAVRAGNPKGIRTWEDLTKPGVEVVTANPFTSGAAKWNILAAYGSQRVQGKSVRGSVAFVRRLFENVVVQARSGRDATNAFVAGKGDVLLAYENEVLLSQRKGLDIPFVIPPQTMIIEAPIVVPTVSERRREAEAFVRYTTSVPGQRIWARYGFRPVNEQVAVETRDRFPDDFVSFRISDAMFGGWAKANERWFDPDGSIMTRIQEATGGGGP